MTGPTLKDVGRRREAPRTVKGKDIELYASDGQAVDVARQRAFTRPPEAPKESRVQRLVNQTPFGKAAKALRDR